MIKVQKSSSYNFKDTVHLDSSHELYLLSLFLSFYDEPAQQSDKMCVEQNCFVFARGKVNILINSGVSSSSAIGRS